MFTLLSLVKLSYFIESYCICCLPFAVHWSYSLAWVQLLYYISVSSFHFNRHPLQYCFRSGICTCILILVFTAKNLQQNFVLIDCTSSTIWLAYWTGKSSVGAISADIFQLWTNYLVWQSFKSCFVTIHIIIHWLTWVYSRQLMDLTPMWIGALKLFLNLPQLYFLTYQS